MSPTEILYLKAHEVSKAAVEPAALAWDVYEALENADDPRKYAAYDHYLALHEAQHKLWEKRQAAYEVFYADKYGPESPWP